MQNLRRGWLGLLDSDRVATVRLIFTYMGGQRSLMQKDIGSNILYVYMQHFLKCDIGLQH
jgi:hypothetical protein